MPISDHGRQGFIYVLENAFTPNLLKIGATRKHPLQRAKELSAATGVAGPFKIVYYRDYSDSFTAESIIHDHFAPYRVNESREFFSVARQEVISFMDALPNLAEYRDLLTSEGVTGGEYREVKLPDTPWAELFSSFEDDGSGRELTDEEREQCRRLATKLSYR